MDGTEIAQKDDLGTLMQKHAAGDTLAITVAREGQAMQTVNVTLGEKTAPQLKSDRKRARLVRGAVFHGAVFFIPPEHGGAVRHQDGFPVIRGCCPATGWKKCRRSAASSCPAGSGTTWAVSVGL